MRAYTRSEAVQLAFADVSERDRKRRKLRRYFTTADRIKHQPGWIPWWLRGGRQNVNRDLPKDPTGGDL